MGYAGGIFTSGQVTGDGTAIITILVDEAIKVSTLIIPNIKSILMLINVRNGIFILKYQSIMTI